MSAMVDMAHRITYSVKEGHVEVCMNHEVRLIFTPRISK